MADVEEFRCFIGGLSWETSDKDLEAAFRRYGRIVEAKVVTDRETGRPRGFGFVTFEDEQGMDDAIDKMHGKELGGREITVSKAQPKSGGGSRGYGGGSGRGGRSSGGRGGSNECFKCGETGHWARECPSGGGGGRDGYGSRGSDRGSDRGDRYGGSRSGGYESSRYSSDRRDDKYGSGGRSSYRDSGGRGSRSGPYDRPNGGSRSSRDDRY